MYFRLIYSKLLKMKIGRPKKSPEERQTDTMIMRVRPSERLAFQMCADLAGISLSSWFRERLRLAAIRELESAGRPVPFVDEIPLGNK